jgi:hypothetical protein
VRGFAASKQGALRRTIFGAIGESSTPVAPLPEVDLRSSQSRFLAAPASAAAHALRLVPRQGQAVLRLERAAVPVAAAALLVSCGGADAGSEASALPDCAGAAETIDRPDALPDDFPVPEGTAFVEERESGLFTLVDARSPGDLEGVRSFFEQELQDGGYRLSGSEAEEHEAELDFAGNGHAGHLVIRSIGACEDAVRVGVATAPG